MGHDPWGCLTAALKRSLRLNSSFPLYCKLCHCFLGLISPFAAMGKYFWVTPCPLVASAEEMAALKHPGCLGEAAGIFAGSPWGLGSFLAQGVWDSCHFCLSHSLSGFQSSIFMLCPPGGDNSWAVPWDMRLSHADALPARGVGSPGMPPSPIQPPWRGWGRGRGEGHRCPPAAAPITASCTHCSGVIPPVRMAQTYLFGLKGVV